MRTPKFDWEAHKDQLLELRYTQGKSLNEITKIVYEKTGIAYTAARVSQVFKGWKASMGTDPVVAQIVEQKYGETN